MAATYQFGAVGATNVAEGTYGFLQDYSESKSSDEATAQNAVGDVGAQNIYNEVTEISATYVFDTTKIAPVPGDSVTIGATLVFTVMTAELTETNTEYTKLAFTAKKYTTVPIPANA